MRVRQRFLFLARAALFTIVFCLALDWVSSILRDKSSSTLPGFYLEERETIDVLFLGTSHVYQSVNPVLLFHEYGIAGYDLTGSAQHLWSTLDYLEEALKIQKPKLAVVDVFSMVLREDYDYDKAYFRKNTQALRSLPIFCRTVGEHVPEGERLSYYFDIIMYHENWKGVNEVSFSTLRPDEPYKGYVYSREVTPAEMISDTSHITGAADIPPKNLEYLNRIIQLLKDNGIEIMLVNMPFVFDVYAGHNSPEMQREILNGVAAFAHEQGIHFVDYTGRQNYADIDWSTDSADGGAHLNIWGAEKLTLHLGGYLLDHYDLPDRRGDMQYASWEESYQKYRQTELAEELRQESDLDSYLALLDNETYTVLICTQGDTISDMPGEIMQRMAALGLEPERVFQRRTSYLAVVEAGNVFYEESSAEAISYSFHLDGKPVLMESKGVSATGDWGTCTASIILDSREYARGATGINIVVYDNVLKEVVDQKVCISATNNGVLYH